MEAHIGDHVVVEGARVGQPRRSGEVLEILRGAGGDRLRVRWEGTDHETVLAPGPDLRVEGTAAGEDPMVERATMRIEVSLSEDADHCEAIARCRMRDRDFSGWGVPAATRPIPPCRSWARSSPSPAPCPTSPTSSSWPRPTRSSPPSAAPWRCTSEVCHRHSHHPRDRGRPAALQALNGRRRTLVVPASEGRATALSPAPLGAARLGRVSPRAETIVFFHAHPDDEAIFTGGTMALLAAAGGGSCWCVATAGEQGDDARRWSGRRSRLAWPPHRRDEPRRPNASASPGSSSSATTTPGWRATRPTRRRARSGRPTPPRPRLAWPAVLDEERARGGRRATTTRGIYGHPDHVQVHRVGRRPQRGRRADDLRSHGRPGVPALRRDAPGRRGHPRRRPRARSGSHIGLPSRRRSTIDASTSGPS